MEFGNQSQCFNLRKFLNFSNVAQANNVANQAQQPQQQQQLHQTDDSTTYVQQAQAPNSQPPILQQTQQQQQQQQQPPPTTSQATTQDSMQAAMQAMPGMQNIHTVPQTGAAPQQQQPQQMQPQSQVIISMHDSRNNSIFKWICQDFENWIWFTE